jgi:hypothetical protein
MTPNTGELRDHPESGFRLDEFEMVHQCSTM